MINDWVLNGVVYSSLSSVTSKETLTNLFGYSILLRFKEEHENDDELAPQATLLSQSVEETNENAAVRIVKKNRKNLTNTKYLEMVDVVQIVLESPVYTDEMAEKIIELVIPSLRYFNKQTKELFRIIIDNERLALLEWMLRLYVR